MSVWIPHAFPAYILVSLPLFSTVDLMFAKALTVEQLNVRCGFLRAQLFACIAPRKLLDAAAQMRSQTGNVKTEVNVAEERKNMSEKCTLQYRLISVRDLLVSGVANV